MTVDDAPRKLWAGYWDAQEKIWASGEKHGLMIVAFAMLKHVGLDGLCWPSEPRLAELCHMDKSTVSKHVTRIRELGWFERIRGGVGRVTSTYRVTILELEDPEPDGFGEFVRSRRQAESRQNTNPALVKHQLCVGKTPTLSRGNTNAELVNHLQEEPIEEPTEELTEEHSTRAPARDAMQEQFERSWRAEQALISFPDGSGYYDEPEYPF